MCDEIVMEKSVTERNDAVGKVISDELRQKSVFCVNVLGSPGAGKTTLIENLAPTLGADNMAVIQGDLESDIDTRRLGAQGIATYQINTHSGCHLNADMVRHAIGHLDLTGKKYLFIENVGNLVCPAGVDIGQHADLVVSSTTEGSDKPRKYPIIFQNARLVVISKFNLSDAVGFDEEAYRHDIHGINPKAKILTMDRDAAGVAAFLKSLDFRRNS
ncbi:MAG: hydrogenase nickel incorporation protein HypB [Nanobdellota archaeon]